MLEFIILKTIGASILKTAAAKAGLAVLGTAYDVYSFFDSLHSVNTCRELGIVGLQVGYEQLSDQAVEYLVNKVVEDTYEIQQHESGFYIAESRLVQQPIFLGSYSEFQAFSPSGFGIIAKPHRADHRVIKSVQSLPIKDQRVNTKKDHRKIQK